MMDTWFVQVLLLLSIGTCLGQSVEYYTDRCLAGISHKDKPGPEPNLYGQCLPWKERSCCTEDITRDFHSKPTWYNFDWNHCEKPISDECRRWMIQDLCFYECSPNLGPWLVPHEITIRDERFMNVPLCRSECNYWFEACKNDLTCKDDWSKGWDWSTGSNECPADSTCETFETKFGTAESFCENLWGGSFEVVNETQHCMSLWFSGNNPNHVVARAKAEELACSADTSKSSTLILSAIIILSSLLLSR